MEDQQGNGGTEQDELDRRREQDDVDQAEGEKDAAGNGAEIDRAEPEEQAEQETTEDIDRAFD